MLEMKKPGVNGSGRQADCESLVALSVKFLEKSRSKRLNRRHAIRARCLDCSGFSAKEVRDCPFTDCPLYPFRLTTGKQDPKKRDKAIRAYCLWCTLDQRKEVKLCPSTDCPLHDFRLTGIKKRHIGQTSSGKNISEGVSPGGAYA